MARVVQLKPKGKNEISLGVASLLAFIYASKKPKIVEISKGAVPFKIDEKWNFDVPIASLIKEY